MRLQLSQPSACYYKPVSERPTPEHYPKFKPYPGNPYLRLPEVGEIFDPPPPLALHVNRGKQHIILVSNGHISNVRHPQYALMDHGFRKLVALTGGQGFDNLIEGKRLDLPDCDLQTATLLHGERGWQEVMSRLHGVPISTSDTPNYSESNELMAAGFPPEVIMFYYVYRHIAQWLRTQEDMQHNPTNYFNRCINTYKQAMLATKNPAASLIQNFNIQDMHYLHQKLLGSPLGTSWNDHWQVLENTVQYWRTDNPVQETAAACAMRRFNHLLGDIDTRWRAGRSLFISWGWQHVYAMEQTNSLQQFGSVMRFEPVDPPSNDVLLIHNKFRDHIEGVEALNPKISPG